MQEKSLGLHFVAIMLGASALGFVKVMLAALLLPQAGFGNYATFLGASAFCGLLISAGRIERTNKDYPRFFLRGHRQKIRVDAWDAAKALLRRSGIATAILAVASAFVDLNFGPLIYLCAGALTLALALLTVITSIIRAIGSEELLKGFALMRSVLPLVAVAATLPTGNWVLLLVAESTASLVLLAISAFILAKYLRDHSAPGEDVQSDSRGGQLFYTASVFSSSVSLIDRGAVNLALGAAAAGAYGIVALMMQAGQLLASVMSQKVGPVIIKLVYDGADKVVLMRQLLMPIGFMIVCTVGLAGVFIAGRQFEMIDAFLDSRSLDNPILLLGALGVLLQFYLIVEFMIIAHDQEMQLLQSSLLAALICYGGFALASATNAPLVYYVLAVVVARAAQLFSLIVAMRAIFSAIDNPTEAPPRRSAGDE